MGRIKLLMVKKTAKQLLIGDEGKFTDKFDHNKKLVRGLLPSKPIENKVAGYIARLIRARSKPVKIRKVEPTEETPTQAEMVQAI
ncbi:MAG TPA: 30S ribosomal protein S17e [Candidatus Nanoarchaeia archaeon]|nr:30S ribosomal protein S17e [Candidatus Nanoarchaeia archaeon]